MEEENKRKWKAFLWVTFVKPFKVFLDSKQLTLVFFIAVFCSVILLKSTFWFTIFAGLTLITMIYDIVKYFKSGEYINEYKSEKYPDYVNAIKKVQKEKKQKHLNSLNSLNNHVKTDTADTEVPTPSSISGDLRRNQTLEEQRERNDIRGDSQNDSKVLEGK